MKVEVSEQVMRFIREQAPEPRQRLRRALRDLGGEEGDIQALEGPLQGYYRWRVGAYRILFAYTTTYSSAVRIQCIYADKRETVYAVFSDIVKRRILEE